MPVIVWPIVFGMLWGFGGLTYGLTMRYLGLSLGMAVVLGVVHRVRHADPAARSGAISPPSCSIRRAAASSCLGLGITMAGIIVVAMAGARKDAALSLEQKAAAVAEFDFRKGIAVAVFSGIMSSCFAFGLAAGEPIKAISAAAGTGRSGLVSRSCVSSCSAA